MAAMVFPSNPTVNQTFTSGSNTWVWNGTTWDAVVNVPNLTGGSAGTLPYQSAASTTAMLPTGPTGSLLSSNGAAAPSWITQSALTVAQSQVTNLATDLAAKASLSGIETLTNKTLTSPVLNGAPLETFNGFAGFAGFTFYATTYGSVQTTFGGNATANGAVNITSTASQTLNTLMSVGQSMTVTLLIQNGSPAYYPTSVQVDGTVTGVTTRWAGGTAPTAGNANAIDIYTFTVFKVAPAQFYIWASITKFA